MKTIKKFPKSPIQPAERVLTFVIKHQSWAVWIIIIRRIIRIKIMNFIRVSCLIAQTQCLTNVWMNINRVNLQHERELTMFRFYFPLFMVLLCDIYAAAFWVFLRAMFCYMFDWKQPARQLNWERDYLQSVK